MRSTLDELTIELSQLKDFVGSIAPVNEALQVHPDSLVKKYVSIRRRFDYAAFTVALYASFEKFVENLVAAYIRLEARRVEYAALPAKLTTKHLVGTAELLSKRRIGEGRYVGMNELSVVKNLFECLSGTNPYTLNEAVITAHDANLRAGDVDAIFGAIGIEKVCERVRTADALLDWYRTTTGLDTTPPTGVSRTVIDERLKAIVERRNQVAHRGGNPDDLLGVDAMNEAIGFVEALCRSIFAMIAYCYLEAHHATSAKRIELELRQGDGPHRKGRVVVVEKPPQGLFVGQPIFATLGSRGAPWGRIQSLRVDDTDVQSVAPDTVGSSGVGVRLDFSYPKNAKAKLIALTADDDVVWAPLPAVV